MWRRPSDDVEVREIRLHSTAVFFAGLGLALSAVAAAMLWLVFTFPVGPVSDIAEQAVVVQACIQAGRTTTSTTAATRGATAASTLPAVCLPPSTAATPAR